MTTEGQDWKGPSFQDAEVENHRAGSRLSFREKIQWLEQAEQTADTFARSRVRVRKSDGPEWTTFHDRNEYLRERNRGCKSELLTSDLCPPIN
jgi:hypothetical protein